jgi:hypothetical protein
MWTGEDSSVSVNRRTLPGGLHPRSRRFVHERTSEFP